MTPRLVHVTTTDMSLDWLLGPQLEAYRRAGYEVFGASAPGSHVAAVEARGVTHVALHHATRAVSPGQDLRAAAELFGALRRLKPDIVHTHNPKPGIYGRIGSRLAGVAVTVNTCHGLYAQPGDPLARRLGVYGLERLAAFASDLELFQNADDLETMARLRVPRRRLRLLGNGIDLARFDPSTLDLERRKGIRADLGVADDEVLVGAVGRLVEEKGLLELFAAAELLRRGHPEVRLVVVGPSEPGKADGVSAGAIERARSGGVMFLGHRDDMVDMYGAMDVYVLASHREGFPRSAMEAAAMGLPLILTDIRGCRDVVDHGHNGWLVPAGDGVKLAATMATLAGDGSRRRAFGEASREKALTSFDQQRVIDLTLAAYEELLAGRRPGRR